MDPLRAIVVDDNLTLLRSVGRLMASMPGVEVVGEATSGRAALAMVARLRPDLVLMDMTMPGIDGPELTRLLSVQPGAPTVIMMTLHDMTEYRDAARAAGAHGFLNKLDLVTHLNALIRSLLPNRFGDESGLT
jgi:DNA-binding NarL/FixJ family response regulator